MRQIETPGYRHVALFYRGDEEFLAGILSIVKEAVDAAQHLSPEVLEAARRNHPQVHEHGYARRSERFTRAIPGPEPLPPPAAEPEELRYGRCGLADLRVSLAARVRHEGLDRARAADLVLAVDELATNTLRYTRGEGVVRIWREDATLLVEVADDGHIADPLAGRDCRPATDLGGRGLYMVNQLCDLVQLRSSPEGSVIRIHMRLD